MFQYSTIIPAFNATKFVGDAVDSALFQTGVENEVIVVDDGSTDNTSEILREYGDRIVTVTQKNAGQAAARNAGARIARGRYLAFLDADDIWLPDKLARQMAVCGELAISHTDSYLFGEALDREMRRSEIAAMKGGWVVEDLVAGNFVTCSSVVVRKDVFEEFCGFDEELSNVEDWDLWLRICAKYELGYVAEPLVRYRVQKSSATFAARKNLPRYLSVLDRAFASIPQLSQDKRPLKSKAYADVYRVLSHYALEGGDSLFAAKCALNSMRYEPFCVGAWKQAIKGGLGAMGLRR